MRKFSVQFEVTRIVLVNDYPTLRNCNLQRDKGLTLHGKLKDGTKVRGKLEHTGPGWIFLKTRNKTCKYKLSAFDYLAATSTPMSHRTCRDWTTGPNHDGFYIKDGKLLVEPDNEDEIIEEAEDEIANEVRDELENGAITDLCIIRLLKEKKRVRHKKSIKYIG
jgi:hypothetical protein